MVWGRENYTNRRAISLPAELSNNTSPHPSSPSSSHQHQLYIFTPLPHLLYRFLSLNIKFTHKPPQPQNNTSHHNRYDPKNPNAARNADFRRWDAGIETEELTPANGLLSLISCAWGVVRVVNEGLTATEVAGRKNMVTRAMAFMVLLSRIMTMLSCWATRLNDLVVFNIFTLCGMKKGRTRSIMFFTLLSKLSRRRFTDLKSPHLCLRSCDVRTVSPDLMSWSWETRRSSTVSEMALNASLRNIRCLAMVCRPTKSCSGLGVVRVFFIVLAISTKACYFILVDIQYVLWASHMFNSSKNRGQIPDLLVHRLKSFIENNHEQLIGVLFNFLPCRVST